MREIELLRRGTKLTSTVILVVFISSLAYILGGFLVLFKKNWTENSLMTLIAFSAGLLLAIALLDLIPDTQEMLSNSSLYVIIGFLIMYFIFLFTKEGASNRPGSNQTMTVTGLSIGMLLHNFFEGLSIGISYTVNVKLGLIVSIALIIHKIPEGLSYSSAMLASLNNRKKATVYLIVQALFTWLGAGAAILLSDLKGASELAVGIALSITAGIFLYLSGTSLLPAMNQLPLKKIPFFFVGGIIVYFLLHSIAEALG